MFEGFIFDVEDTLVDSSRETCTACRTPWRDQGTEFRSRRFSSIPASTAIRRGSLRSRTRRGTSAPQYSKTAVNSMSEIICRASNHLRAHATFSGFWAGKGAGSRLPPTVKEWPSNGTWPFWTPATSSRQPPGRRPRTRKAGPAPGRRRMAQAWYRQFAGGHDRRHALRCGSGPRGGHEGGRRSNRRFFRARAP
jgi:hypothetical protein